MIINVPVSRDNYLDGSAEHQDAHRGGETYSLIGDFNGGGEFRPLLDFSLQGLANNERLVSAKIQMQINTTSPAHVRCRHSSQYTGCARVHVVTRSWGVGSSNHGTALQGQSSWIHSKSPTRWSRPGGDFESAVIGQRSSSSEVADNRQFINGGTAEFPLNVNRVSQLLNNQNGYFGFLIKDENDPGYLQLFSSKSSRQPPTLILEFAPATSPPTRQPTRLPTRQPTRSPTRQPTRLPTRQPTRSPTRQPTRLPTRQPTRSPTRQPTRLPTSQPIRSPTARPTRRPTLPPTRLPTRPPTQPPTRRPTLPPTRGPTLPPTRRPTLPPTRPPTQRPTSPPTRNPTPPPMVGVTPPPTTRPTTPPTRRPTSTPTRNPTPPPIRPSAAASKSPTVQATNIPTQIWLPGNSVTYLPSARPRSGEMVFSDRPSTSSTTVSPTTATTSISIAQTSQPSSPTFSEESEGTCGNFLQSLEMRSSLSFVRLGQFDRLFGQELEILSPKYIGDVDKVTTFAFMSPSEQMEKLEGNTSSLALVSLRYRLCYQVSAGSELVSRVQDYPDQFAKYMAVLVNRDEFESRLEVGNFMIIPGSLTEPSFLIINDQSDSPTPAPAAGGPNLAGSNRSTSSNSNTVGIIGGVIGGIVAFSALVVGFWCYKRKSSAKAASVSTTTNNEAGVPTQSSSSVPMVTTAFIPGVDRRRDNLTYKDQGRSVPEEDEATPVPNGGDLDGLAGYHYYKDQGQTYEAERSNQQPKDDLDDDWSV